MSDYLESELGEGLTIKEYAQKLLDKNVKLIDTAQLSLFGETKQQDTKNQYGLYKTNTVKEAVEEFKAWLTGEKHTDKLQDYRKAIIDKVSELKGKQIKTDKENVEFANTLDWIINNPNSVVGTLGETLGKSIASLGFTQSQWDSFSQEKRITLKNVTNYDTLCTNKYQRI